MQNEKISEEQHHKNVELLNEAIVKVSKDEFKDTQELHKWLYAKGYYAGEKFRIRQLHMVEQTDAEYYNKEK